MAEIRWRWTHGLQPQCPPKRVHVPMVLGLVAVLLANPAWAGVSQTASIRLDGAIAQGTTQTSTLLEQGRQRYETGQFAEALNLWQQAYPLEGNPLNQALSLSLVSLATQKLGQWEQSQEAIEQSLTLLQTQPNLDDRGLSILAQALNTQGSLQLARGKTAAALESWEEAEATYTEARDETGRLGSQINQAQALQTLGLYRRAKTVLEQVNETLQAQPDNGLKAAGLRSLGVALQVLGDVKTSQTVLEQSLAIAKTLNTSSDISATLFQLGNLARTRSENLDLALDFYQEAAAAAPTPLSQLQAQLNQLSLLVKTQQWDAARSLRSPIESNLAQLQPSRAGVYAQVNFAESLISIQNSTFNIQNSQLQSPEEGSIAPLLATAIAHARTLNDPKAESYALGYLGQLYEQTQQWQEAQDLTQQALVLAQAIDAGEIAYRWQWQLGRILCQGVTPCAYTGNLPNAIAAYTEAVNTLETLRSDLVSDPEAQFSFQERVEPVYRELVSLLLQSNPSQKDLKQAREVIESLQLAELENFLREACLDAQPQQIDRIDPTAAVIYPIILPHKLAVILSLPDGTLSHVETPISAEEVDRLVGEMREALNPAFPNQLRLQLSQQIYDWLIRPMEGILTANGVETLVFVPDGAFRNIPIAALHDGDRYLIEQYGVALTPGLQLLEPEAIAQEQLAILTGGITEARQGFSALPGVEFEVNQISTRAPTQVFLNQEFTKTNLKTRIDSIPFPVLHLATHGQFSSNPEQTFILTWDDKVGVKEFTDLLTVREQNQATSIELLVLSACQTALGDNRAALGLAGLAVRSGARSTLATLWAVNDESTATLMVEFYRQLTQTQEASKSKALRQAQLALLQEPQYKHPYFWAPFVLVGNWL